MKNFLSGFAVLALLAGCSGNPWAPPVPPDPGGTGALPAEVTRDLRSITYSAAGGGQLTVNLNGLVGSSAGVTFVRNAALDVDGYQAFVYQETALQRSYLAYVATNSRGNLISAAVADGGQFGTYTGGTTVARIGMYTAPAVSSGVETGQFSYAGSYVGVLVPGDTAGAGNNVPAGLDANSTYTVKGEALINANFANNLVNGGVDTRKVYDLNGNQVDLNQDSVLDASDQLPTIAMATTAIDSTGSFTGDVLVGSNVAGTYAGMFGGTSASDVAAVLVFYPYGSSPPEEFGTLNLPRCDLAGASPLCIPR